MAAFEPGFNADRPSELNNSDRSAGPTGSADPARSPGAGAVPDLPVAVFRPSPDDRMLVAGPCHARALCLSAAATASGVAAVFVDPCGMLLAIATAPPAVVDAIVVDAAPFARLTEQLGASRIYLEVPSGDATAVADAVSAALWPLPIVTEVLPRAWAA